MVRIIEPIALINIILLVVLSILFNRVDKEVPSLKKAKIAKTDNQVAFFTNRQKTL